jgi:imidazolonepropionase-like amidohydrolase
MMLEGWTWEEMTLKAPLGLVVNWPAMVHTPNPFSSQTKEEWLKQRNQTLAELRAAFENARAYRTARAAKDPSFETDPRWEAMFPVLSGAVPMIVNAGELAQIQSAVAFAEEQGVRMILAGGADAWRVADLLKAKNISVIVSDIQSAGRRWEAYDAIFSLPKKLHDAGVRFCITGDRSSANARNVPFHAAQAAAYGLPRDAALRAITLAAAQILGIADRVGSIEPGKDANLVVVDGDILEIRSTIHQVYIQGRKVDMRDKHTRLYQKYQEKYRQNTK